MLRRSTRKRNAGTSPYFGVGGEESPEQKRIRPELLQTPSPVPATAVHASSPELKLSPKTDPTALGEPPPPARTGSDELMADISFPLPKPPRTRCALHEAILARETNLWRTMDLITASAPYLRHLRLRAVSESLAHRTYSMSFSRPSGGVIALAGGEGRITVLPTLSLRSYNGEDASTPSLHPALSFVAHSKWVSGLQFLHSSHEPRLLSSSDAGDVSMWRLDGTEGVAMRNTLLCTERSAHDLGIWSLHEINSRLVTSSKDKTVKVWSLLESGLSCTHTYTDLHTDTIKCVRWRDHVTFATCSNDKLQHVVDTRLGRAVITLIGMHHFAVNTVAWRPYHENFLLTSGFDSHINITDIRFPTKPLFKLSGHAPGERVNAVFHPIFFYYGAYVATCTEKSQRVWLYDASTGNMARKPLLGQHLMGVCTPSPSSATMALVTTTKLFITDFAMTETKEQ